MYVLSNPSKWPKSGQAAMNKLALSTSIDDLMNEFRIASRELFNLHFRIEDPYENNGWVLAERFAAVERVLFEKLVLDPAGIESVPYGTAIPELQVKLRGGDSAPIMLNREVDSGYWDHPTREVSSSVTLAFIRFFDWDQLSYRDNRFTRVVVIDWPGQRDHIDKHALIEAQCVCYSLEHKP